MVKMGPSVSTVGTLNLSESLKRLSASFHFLLPMTRGRLEDVPLERLGFSIFFHVELYFGHNIVPFSINKGMPRGNRLGLESRFGVASVLKNEFQCYIVS